jgi:hypothetical protein
VATERYPNPALFVAEGTGMATEEGFELGLRCVRFWTEGT